MILKLIFACWDVFALFWIVNLFSNKRTVRRESGASRLRYWLLFMLAFGLLFGGGFGHRHHAGAGTVLPRSATLNGLALVITVLGLALAIWARVTLGRNWSGTVTLKENHELIQRGPYAAVRHPIYTAMLLMFAGTALAVGTWEAFVGLPLLFLSFWIKYREEEAFMIAQFGDPYRTYMKRVRALVPFVF
jgi:protein-S-isoprenylcysteine O-methyltransferase Ste14